MTCPQKGRQVRPSRCLTCEHCGGLSNGGVLCFKANRKLKYSFDGKNVIDLVRERKL